MADDRGPGDDQGAGRRVAVVVVHGVGDTTPGLALNELVDTLAKHHPDEVEAKSYCEVYPLTAAPVVKGDDVDAFPACARSVTLRPSGDEVRFYDLHWADLTRGAPGRLNTLLGSFRIIFESHHFIDAMLPKDGGRVVRALRRLLLSASAVLRGAIVGLSACLLAVGFAFYYTRNYLIDYAGRDPASLHQITAMVLWLSLAGAMLAALIFLYRRRRLSETEWKDVFLAVVVGAVLIAAYGVYLYYHPVRGGDVDFDKIAAATEKPPMCLYVTRLYLLIQNGRVLWCVLMALALIMVALLYLRVWRTPVRPGAAMAAFSIAVLQSALWLSLISAIGIPFIHWASLHERLRSGAEGNACDLDSLYVSFLGTALLLGGVLYMAVLTYLFRYLLARARVLSLAWRERLMPRMLFGGMITTFVLIGSFLQLCMFALVYVHDVMGNELMSWFSQTIVQTIVQWLPWEDAGRFVKTAVTDIGNNKFKFYGVAAGAVALVSVVGFTTAIHITRDLIDHQYSPRLGYSYYVLPRFLFPQRDRDIKRPRRARIRQRLDALAEQVICKPPLFTDLVFVAHSQGSVIVYDYLRTGGDQCEQLLCARPHLVTFGSPLGHLYRHYFKEYGDLAGRIAGLQPRLASWTNLYRVDDYVGQRIDDDHNFVRNVVIEAGGHTNYWCERQLCDIILDCIRTPAGHRASRGARPGVTA